MSAGNSRNTGYLRRKTLRQIARTAAHSGHIRRGHAAYIAIIGNQLDGVAGHVSLIRYREYVNLLTRLGTPSEAQSGTLGESRERKIPSALYTARAHVTPKQFLDENALESERRIADHYAADL